MSKIVENCWWLHHVCPSVSIRMAQPVSHCKDFHEILYFSIFPTYVQNIQDSLKSETVNNTSHKDLSTFIYLSKFLLEWEMF